VNRSPLPRLADVRLWLLDLVEADALATAERAKCLSAPCRIGAVLLENNLLIPRPSDRPFLNFACISIWAVVCHWTASGAFAAKNLHSPPIDHPRSFQGVSSTISLSPSREINALKGAWIAFAVPDPNPTPAPNGLPFDSLLRADRPDEEGQRACSINSWQGECALTKPCVLMLLTFTFFRMRFCYVMIGFAAASATI